ASGASTKSSIRSCGEAHNTKSSSSNIQINKIQLEKKLLALDLDETLAHNGGSPVPGETCALSFKGGESTYYIYTWTYVSELLERVSELYTVVIFTASDKEYVDQVLDFLDPQGKLISGHYYYDSGTYLDHDGLCVNNHTGSYVKDLRLFGVDLKNVILVNNVPSNYRLQKNNGIPIKSWYFYTQDTELSTLLPFLKTLAAADDVRTVIAEIFSHIKNENKGCGGGKQDKSTKDTK
ncbi:hypothetical protein MKW98_026379, partial [Papaver atlanticum]